MPKIRVEQLIFFGILMLMMGTRMAELNAVIYTDWMTFSDDIPDRIPDEDILLFKDRFVVVGNYQLAQYSDTNSMLPTLDKGSTGLQLPVYANTTLYVGDIISYRVPGRNVTYAHRIIDLGLDDEGEYYILKGDNLYYPDPYKVRKHWIQRVTVGVIW